jgi:peptidoglycan/LPS O-acetylase OafA/YrhL
MTTNTATEIPAQSSLKPAQVGTSHTNNFNLLRVVAAIQVLLFHSCARLHVSVPSWLEPLHMLPGVPIFFVISGFLVSASLERNRDNLRVYFRNRAVRIYPGLWCCIVLTVAAFLVFGFHPGIGQFVTWFGLQLAGLIYTPHFLSTFGSGTYNGSLWTIPVELQFYIVLPILYWLGSKAGSRRGFTLFAFAAFTVLAVLLVHWIPSTLDPGPNEGHWEKLLRYSFIPRFYLFVFGIVIQQFALQKHRFVAGKGLLWLILYLLSAMVFRSRVSEVVNLVLLGLAAISCAYTMPRLSERTIGGLDLSYGVYIYHGLIINLLVQLGIGGHGRDVVIVLVTSLLVGALSWYLVEKPFLSRKKPLRRATGESLSRGVAVM